MNKRGQVFLIAAIIFSLAIYSVAIEYNTIKTYPGLEDYKELSENYQTEYPKVFNFAVYNGSDTGEALSNFTQAFLGQTEQTDPNFGVFYLYKDTEGNLHIVNTLSNKILKINLVNIDTEEVDVFIPPSGAESDGRICVMGIGEGSCTTTGASLEEFGAGYDSEETLEEAATLCMEVPDIGFTRCLLEEELANFRTIEVITSEGPIEEFSGADGRNVAVEIIEA